MTIRDLFPDTKPSLLLDFARVKSLDPRVTFTRASGAVYYDGVTVAKAEENLVTYSNDFNTASWNLQSNVSQTANNTAPDGSSTAALIQINAAGSQNVRGLNLRTRVPVTAGSTLSVFAKAGTASWLGISNEFNATGWAYFDLTNGVVGNSLGCTASIVSVGNGWYRCVVANSSYSSASGTFFLLSVKTADAAVEPWAGSQTYVSGENLYIWGAQLEQRSAVTAYTPTTTAAITRYQPQLLTAANNQARFDHSPVTNESLGLFIEVLKANLATRSEEFNVSPWGVVRSSVSANVMIAPDGTMTADKHIEDLTLGTHDVSQNYTATSGSTYTFSVYAKAAERTQCSVRLNRLSGGNLFSGNPQVVVNLTDGSMVSTSNVLAYTINYVGNGWYRISVTQTATGTGTQNITVGPYLDGAGSYTGDGYSGIYVWGAQLEVNAFPTSYIKTEASQVTRAADSASMTGTNFSSWYNQTEGTIFVDAKLPEGPTGTLLTHAISNNNSFNSSIYGVITQTTYKGSYVGVGGVGQADDIGQFTGLSAKDGIKDAFAYKVNDFAESCNGITARVDTSGSVPTVDRLYLGAYWEGTASFSGTLRKFAYYPYRVPNIELQALTKL